MITVDELFDALDLGSDGELSRAELHQAARELRWHWHEAPLYAALDVLTIEAPLSRESFRGVLAEILRDPRGPYGEVLLRAPRPWRAPDSRNAAAGRSGLPGAPNRDGSPSEALTDVLHSALSDEAAHDYQALLTSLPSEDAQCSTGDSALLLVDPQHSFTSGAWKRSVGRGADVEVEPLRAAFGQCGRLLGALRERAEILFTRCPFPPESYEWDEQVAPWISPAQPYFVKPGNSALWPTTNGFAEWLESLVQRGYHQLVMGGCTLNSCIRVSASQTAERLRGRPLRVMVDLSLCGARASNYARSPLFGGRSSVESAVHEMADAGVLVVDQAVWR